jgi:hypothetical protein
LSSAFRRSSAPPLQPARPRPQPSPRMLAELRRQPFPHLLGPALPISDIAGPAPRAGGGKRSVTPTSRKPLVAETRVERFGCRGRHIFQVARVPSGADRSRAEEIVRKMGTRGAASEFGASLKPLWVMAWSSNLRATPPPLATALIRQTRVERRTRRTRPSTRDRQGTRSSCTTDHCSN